MRLPSVQDRLTLGDLRQELSSVFGVPAQRTRIILQGMVLKDDRLPLTDYGMTTGARVVLMATSPRGQRQAPAAGPQAAPEAQAPQQQAPPQEQAPAMSPEERDLAQIKSVLGHCHTELLPELTHFEQSISGYPSAPPGEAPESTQDPNALPPKKVPVTQRKLSELFLRQLLRLDEIPVDSDTIRNERRAAVKEIQSYLERVDTAWRLATSQKGIVSDV